MEPKVETNSVSVRLTPVEAQKLRVFLPRYNDRLARLKDAISAGNPRIADGIRRELIDLRNEYPSSAQVIDEITKAHCRELREFTQESDIYMRFET